MSSLIQVNNWVFVPCLDSFTKSTEATTPESSMEMGSPSYDLRSLCSSPLFYRDGEDFLGQPVNDINDDDITFEFLDDFGMDFSTSRRDTNLLTTTRQEAEKNATTTTPPSKLDGAVDDALTGEDDKITFNAKSQSTALPLIETNYFHGARNKSVPEGGTDTDENKATKAENLHFNGWRRRVESSTLENDLTDKHIFVVIDHFNGAKNGGTSENVKDHVSAGAYHKHLEENAGSKKDLNAKQKTFDTVVLPTHVGHKTSSENIKSENSFCGKDTKMENLKRINVSSSSLKVNNAVSRRSIAPKTFYPPFWKSEKYTTKQETNIETEDSGSQRKLDTLQSWSYRTQKRDTKNTRFKIKGQAGYKDKKYADFLKRNSDFQQLGNPCNRRTGIAEITREHSDGAEWKTEQKKWISLPTIYTPSMLNPKADHPRKKTNKNNYSLSSIEALIKEYRAHGFDLVEQRKRYKLKTFK